MIMREIKVVMAIVLICGSIEMGFAQEAKGKEKNIIKSTINEVSGEISAIGKDFIAVIYKRDEKIGAEYEMLVPIDINTKLERKKSLSELNIGDTIKIQCEDMTLANASGEKKMERKAKTISFVKPAVKKPEPPRPPEPGEGIPND